MRRTHFTPPDGSLWPMPRPEIEHALRYGGMTRQQELAAASILSAYAALLDAPHRKAMQVRQAWRNTTEKS